MPANHPITIFRELAPNQLEMTNRGNADTNSGDTVTWIVPRSSGVTVTSILTKGGSQDVFVSPPTRIGSSPNWRGTIKTVGSPMEGDYLINYRVGSNERRHDPKIFVNPTLHNNGFLKVAAAMTLGLGFLALSLLLLKRRKHNPKEKFNERQK